jgi:hypothetical protein
MGERRVSHEYKVCPSCLDEFTLVVSVCAACEVDLVAPGDLPDEGEEEPDAFPEIADLACVRVGPLPWTRALSDALTAAGIGHRVERDTRSEEEGGVGRGKFGGEEVYGTWVRPEDMDGAREFDGLLFAQFEPDREAEATDEEACPACGAPLAIDAVECSDCGLSFG